MRKRSVGVRAVQLDDELDFYVSAAAEYAPERFTILLDPRALAPQD